MSRRGRFEACLGIGSELASQIIFPRESGLAKDLESFRWRGARGLKVWLAAQVNAGESARSWRKRMHGKGAVIVGLGTRLIDARSSLALEAGRAFDWLSIGHHDF